MATKFYTLEGETGNGENATIEMDGAEIADGQAQAAMIQATITLADMGYGRDHILAMVDAGILQVKLERARKANDYLSEGHDSPPPF